MGVFVSSTPFLALLNNHNYAVRVVGPTTTDKISDPWFFTKVGFGVLDTATSPQTAEDGLNKDLEHTGARAADAVGVELPSLQCYNVLRIEGF